MIISSNSQAFLSSNNSNLSLCNLAKPSNMNLLAEVDIYAATAMLLNSGGELVAITPRSFCNGPYFRNFRKMFLEMMALQQIYLFESRQEAFSDDNVLQETLIIHAKKQKHQREKVLINTSFGIDDDLIMSNSVPYANLVHPDDPEQFIHILPDTLVLKLYIRSKKAHWNYYEPTILKNGKRVFALILLQSKPSNSVMLKNVKCLVFP